MSDRIYYEAFMDRSGDWYWKVYKYDTTGNREIRIATGEGFDTEGEAVDACVEWQEENGMEAELG